MKRLPLSQTNRPIDVIRHWRNEGYLLLNPPYQRGDVWGEIRRRNLIRSILLGVPIPSLIINDRFSAEWGADASIAVIDGKQRMTAILMLLEGQLGVPGEWFDMDAPSVVFRDLSPTWQRRIQNQPIPFSEGRLATLEDEREVFELVNFGGVPQGESDLP